ncbi:hypothetical protein I317_03938 [Kwoniella heveanensis CBS 569]|uniref:Uncharacterized protein n=1 Tax=Kwoniella heveanensis BCC8398 TaxID=1296120 RepID=A0A1B9H3Y4_9TREE|nr:hypothetical protein I316_00201 [Kwoniella heveanensis BCC8398]OCF42203.1 hypothetical protein I317_03938 [Kwoniella heveanensis CBS 569]
MSDPNFPPNLNIKPLGSSNVTDDQQRDAIVTYGIAGRVWEATRPLLEYFSPSNKFDPPCSLLSNGEKKVIELGSGQSVASLHLAKQLQRDDLVVLTDLPEVVPLCEQAIQRNDSTAQVIAQPLAWGEDAAHLRQFGPFTHVLMCDLVGTFDVSLADFQDLLPSPIPSLATHLVVSDRAGNRDTRRDFWT